MKEIKINVLTLVAIALIVSSLIIGIIAYYNYKNRECLKNPVAYANNYSDDYWWDYVQPISTKNLMQYNP